MKKGLPQFFRYAFVGIVSNLALYVLYLGLTWAGMGHKSAMTLLYVMGILQTYIFNRNWTFRHDGRMSTSFVRYASTYIAGYLFQLGALFVLVDLVGLPHQLVMAVLIFVTAVLIFLLQKFWVFSTTPIPVTGMNAEPGRQFGPR